MNILKSLVIWEKAHRKSENKNENLPRGLDGSNGKGESLSNSGALKVYKSTVEASVSEVCTFALLFYISPDAQFIHSSDIFMAIFSR